MYTRLIILTVIVVVALCGLSVLGYHAVAKWAEGLEGARLGEFAEVAEQVRQDVKRKLDEFIQAEQQRRYTDYLYYYVPENVAGTAQQLPLLRSPLGSQISNKFAYGYFQVEPDGTIVTPYYQEEQDPASDSDKVVSEAERLLSNIRNNVLPSITSTSGTIGLRDSEPSVLTVGETAASGRILSDREALGRAVEGLKQSQARTKNYAIESLRQQAQQPQTYTQQRSVAASNQSQALRPEPRVPASRRARPPRMAADEREELAEVTTDVAPLPTWSYDQVSTASAKEEQAPQTNASDTVQIRVEPFVPVVVPAEGGQPSIFGGQVFLLRHVQIESRHLLQGFQLDEDRLIVEVQESARRFTREGMTFALPQVAPTGSTLQEQTAYTAILDFGFGDLVLNLQEVDPAWIVRRIGDLQHIYFGIIAIVAAAVILALTSLWHNVRAQVKLAQKKDDFISAVSHELRTPLTSIRMYAEMLENNWVKSQDKLAEYYRNMRQESERLSRLVENVLDFSRIQKGRKRYAFTLGDLNDCISEVVTMMGPYAAQRGFAIETQLASLGETAFDRDAVTQIVVNLIDNAVKYAPAATDKTVTVRTQREGHFAVIEVEDHGPGIPHRQRRKVFDQFYRYGTEPNQPAPNSGRSHTTGTGLGLALVKRFAEAHHGFVEIRSAQPSGAILKVALSTDL